MKTTVQVEGKSYEVDIPGVVAEADVAAKYMPKEVVERIVQDRLTQFAQGRVKVDELDAAAIQSLAEKRGLKLASSGAPNDDIAKQLTQARADWTKQELEPVLAREQASKADVQTLRRGQLTAAIKAAGARFFKDVLLTPPMAGASTPLETMLEPIHAFNEQTKTWHVKSAEGFAISGDPQKYGVYKTPEESVAELAKNPAYKDFLRVEMQSGPGANNGGGSDGAGTVVMTSAQAGNKQLYDAALAKVGNDPTRIRVADAQG